MLPHPHPVVKRALDFLETVNWCKMVSLHSSEEAEKSDPSPRITDCLAASAQMCPVNYRILRQERVGDVLEIGPGPSPDLNGALRRLLTVSKTNSMCP